MNEQEQVNLTEQDAVEATSQAVNTAGDYQTDEAIADAAGDASGGASGDSSGDAGSSAGQEKSEFNQLLDDLSEPDPNARQAQIKADDADDVPAGERHSDAMARPAEAAPSAQYDELEQALLSEAKTDRSRNRIKRFIADHKALESAHQSMSAEYQTIATAIANTGMDETGIAQVLNFCELSASNDPDKMQVALEMLDKTRADLLSRINPVGKFDDIQKAVDDFELPEEYAAELARYREQSSRMKAQQAQQAQVHQYQARAAAATRKIEAMLAERRNDPDYRQKYRAIAGKVNDKQFVDYMAQNFTPEQWPAQIMFMYDNMQLATRAQSPLRSTNTNLGRVHMTDNSGSSILRKIEEMGL